MTDIQKLYRRVGELEDTITRLRKDLKYQQYNLDEDSLPRLRVYSQLISQNKAAVSEVKQEVSDTQATVSLLSQYTNMDGVVVVESSDDKSAWDKTRVYYDSTAKVYYYHDGTQWQATASPVTAGLDTSIAQIQAKTAENEAQITLVSQSVTQNAADIVDLQNLTGQIDNELTEVTKNLASVETKADDAAASAEMAAQSVTELENEVTGQITTINQNLASVSTKADNASASVSAIVSNIGSDGSVTAASIVAKINAAGSAVQISADHISLKGKTIALTTDSINIESTYFDVTTAGAVTCSSIAVSGVNSSIDVSGSAATTAKISVRHNGNSYPYSQMTPQSTLYIGSSSVENNVGYDGMYTIGYSGGYQLINNFVAGTLEMSSSRNSSSAFPTLRVLSDSNQVVAGGMFTCTGLKSRTEQTEHYGNRLMYAFETPNPLYSDIGRATISEDGLCYVFLDPVFFECIDNSYDYFVFIQPESDSSFTVIERTNDHFAVQGTPGASFAWMLITAQRGYSATRTEELIVPETDPPQTPDPENAVYDTVGDTIMNEYESQLG